MGFRYVLSPDKLEYMLPLLVVVLLAEAHERFSSVCVAALSISMIATSAVCVSLFERTGAADRLTVSIGVNKGALAQDWEVTHFDDIVTSRGFLDQLADIVYASEPGLRPQVSAPNFHIGLTSDMNDLIIGEQQLYQLDNRRFPSPIHLRSSYRRIYICDGSLRRFRPGWRVFQRQPALPRIDPQTGRIVLHCRREGQRDHE